MKMRAEKSNNTMLLLTVGFLILHVVFSIRWALTTAIIVGAIGVLSPYLSRKIEWVWMKFSDISGYFIPKVLLSLLFFLILFPISLIYRIFRKDPLMLSNNYKTFFIDINKETDKKSFEKTW